MPDGDGPSGFGSSDVDSSTGEGSLVAVAGSSLVGSAVVSGCGGGVQRRVDVCAGGVHGAGAHDEVVAGVQDGSVEVSAGGGVHSLVAGVEVDRDDEGLVDVVRDDVLGERGVEVLSLLVELQAAGDGVMPSTASWPSPTPRANAVVVAAKPAARTSARASPRRISAPRGWCSR